MTSPEEEAERIGATLVTADRPLASAPASSALLPEVAPRGSIKRMAEAAQPLQRELDEIGAQLAWVRDYL